MSDGEKMEKGIWLSGKPLKEAVVSDVFSFFLYMLSIYL